jgi:hypothetical protein
VHSNGQLRATIDAASDFGLSENEIWITMIEVCERVPVGAGDGDSLEELSAALASRILERARDSAR